MNDKDAELRERRMMAIERFMLTHPKVVLGEKPYTYEMPFDVMYEVIDEYVERQKIAHADMVIGEDYTFTDSTKTHPTYAMKIRNNEHARQRKRNK